MSASSACVILTKTMKLRVVLLCCVVVLTNSIAVSGNENEEPVTEETVGELSPEKISLLEMKLSDAILTVLEHYKQEDPVGIPNIPVPDPYPIPDMKKSFSLATMTFKNTNVYGLSKFRIRRVFADAKAMELSAAVDVETLHMAGNYTLSSMFSRGAGPFTIDLKNVVAQATIKIEVTKNGKLRAQDLIFNVTPGKLAINFENLGLLGSMFQGVVNSAGTFLFDSIKPKVLDELNSNVTRIFNNHTANMKEQLPNSIAPLDMAIILGRKHVRKIGYDPYTIADHQYNNKVLGVTFSSIKVTGLSSFHRVGNITASMANNTLHFGLQGGTLKLMGTCFWDLSFAGFLSREGYASFEIAYLKFHVNASQALDVRKRPRLDEFKMTAGNIQLRIDGLGTTDYVLETLVNIFPNVLRNHILKVLENPIKSRVQEILDHADVESVIEDYLPMIDDNVQSLNDI